MADDGGSPSPGADADDGAAPGLPPPPPVHIADGPPLDPALKELGCLATWSVSTAKPGNGADLLRDGRTDTYWQSDGPGPHLITAALPAAHRLCLLALAVDHRLDESYTPSTLSVRAGSWGGDLKEVAVATLSEPVGWALIPLTPPPGSLLPADGGGGGGGGGGAPHPHPHPIRAAVLQVAVQANHQNGRDTHVRQALLFGPRSSAGDGGGAGLGADIPLRSVEAAAWAGVR